MNFLILKQFFIFFKDVKFHAAAVAFGGALGALARCGVSLSVDNQILAVFICNICGSFILATAIELRTKIRSELESLVSIGFCGGLSIFASFSRDSVAALRAENFSLFFINLSANFILCVCAVLAAQFLAEKLRYISAYLKDSEESQKYDSATGKIFDAIRHSFSRPNIEKIPTISERAMVQPRTPAPPPSKSIPQPPICPQGGTGSTGGEKS